MVLPFTSIGGGPEQAYFADGITDDLTTDLSRIDGSFVIARNTAFTYQGKPIDACRLGRELGVRYILGGSPRRAGTQIRINVQLIDATTSGAVWSDRFEGDWTRSMERQDELTGRLAHAMDLELTLARVLSAAAGHMSADPADDLARAEACVSRVLAKLPNHAMAHSMRGEILLTQRQFDAAVQDYEAAIANNRGLAPAYGAIERALIRAGRAEEAFKPLEMAIRLSPRDPLLNVRYFSIHHAHPWDRTRRPSRGAPGPSISPPTGSPTSARPMPGPIGLPKRTRP